MSNDFGRFCGYAIVGAMTAALVIFCLWLCVLMLRSIGVGS